MTDLSFHTCENCTGSCEKTAREALVGRYGREFQAEAVLRGQDAPGFAPDHTPWGKPDATPRSIRAGILQYTTPSHGGMWVAPAVRKRIPACVQLATGQQLGVAGWFEEDADWNWVVACLPDLFGQQKALAACGVLSSMADYHMRNGGTRFELFKLALRYVRALNDLPPYGWTEVAA